MSPLNEFPMTSDPDSSVAFRTSKGTKKFSSLFANPSKVVFASCGHSKLLCFDQIHAYIVNVSTEEGEVFFTCSAVIILEPLPFLGDEIEAIKINTDSSRAVLVSARYVYTFGIPDFQKTIPKHAELENGVPKYFVNLVTLDPLVNSSKILKVQWLRSTVVHKNVQLANCIGVLYYGNLLRIFNTKHPEISYDLNFKSLVMNSVKEQEQHSINGFGLKKMITTFDFGCVFGEKEFFLTVYAIDNESEVYYSGISITSDGLVPGPIVGPVVSISNSIIEPVDCAFIHHEESDSVAVFAVAQFDGTIAHIAAIPTDDWDKILEGVECFNFFVMEFVQLRTSSSIQLMVDPVNDGEYAVFFANNILVISVLPLLLNLLQNVPSDSANLMAKNFRCLDFLNPVTEDYTRFLVAVDSDGDFHGKTLPLLWEDLAPKKSTKVPFDDYPPVITQNPAPANIPLINASDEVIPDEAIPTCTTALRTFAERAMANVNVIQEATKGIHMVHSRNEKLVNQYNELYDRVITLADKQKDIQPENQKQFEAIDELRTHVDKVYASVPRERLTEEHLKNEEKVYELKKNIQEAISNVNEANVKAIILRSEYFNKQPSFQPSAHAAKFMLTTGDVKVEELKNEVVNLTKDISKLVQISDYAQRMNI